ncbi:MAG: hypothetical protein JWQ02_1035 [Capsulimonas sp.]|nr:hypothetical protein [Capsulimonas sp.]
MTVPISASTMEAILASGGSRKSSARESKAPSTITSDPAPISTPDTVSVPVSGVQLIELQKAVHDAESEFNRLELERLNVPALRRAAIDNNDMVQMAALQEREWSIRGEVAEAERIMLDARQALALVTMPPEPTSPPGAAIQVTPPSAPDPEIPLPPAENSDGDLEGLRIKLEDCVDAEAVIRTEAEELPRLLREAVIIGDPAAIRLHRQRREDIEHELVAAKIATLRAREVLFRRRADIAREALGVASENLTRLSDLAIEAAERLDTARGASEGLQAESLTCNAWAAQTAGQIRQLLDSRSKAATRMFGFGG